MDINYSLRKMTAWLLCLALSLDVSIARIKLRKLCKGTSMELTGARGVQIEPLAPSSVHLLLAENYVMAQRELKISFEFRTTSPHGVLFLARPLRQPEQAVALWLKDGRVQYHVTCPRGWVDATLYTAPHPGHAGHPGATGATAGRSHGAQRLDDGRWHTITWSLKYKRRQRAHITVDGRPALKRYDVGCAPLATVTMGGMTPLDRAHAHRFKSKVGGHFQGCIRNLKLPVPLRSPPRYSAVSGCDNAQLDIEEWLDR